MIKPLRMRYQTIEIGEKDIHLCTLRDRQQFSDPYLKARKLGISSASWPIFGIVWPSSLVLAHFIEHHHTENKRILEVGCGIALSSLLLNEQSADITATDYHPEVEPFLRRNVELNCGRALAYEQTDWSRQGDDLGLFDLIIGSDLLYEDDHIPLLANFIDNHAKSECEVIVVDPGRGRKNKFSQQMENHGFECSHLKPAHTEYLEEPFRGHILAFWRDAAYRC